MSKLNPTAFTFVPRFAAPAQPAEPPPPPIERPEQTEAPRPAPTISLNIGGASTPARPPPAAQPAPSPPPAAPAAPAKPVQPEVKSVKVTKAETSSKTFSTEKSKTDTQAIAQEVKALADKTVIDDLYGSRAFFNGSILSPIDLFFFL